MKPPVDAPASSARRPSGSTAKRVEGGVELLPAPADERCGGPCSTMGSSGATWRAALSACGPRHQDDPGGDRHLGLVPVGDQAPPHELGVEPAARPWAQLLDPGVSWGRRARRLGWRRLLGRGPSWSATVLAAAFLAAARSAGSLVAAFFLTAGDLLRRVLDRGGGHFFRGLLDGLA